MTLSKDEMGRLRQVMIQFVNRYSRQYHVTQGEAFEVCEACALRLFGVHVYPSYNAYKIALIRQPRGTLQGRETQFQDLVAEWESFMFETHHDQMRGEFEDSEKSLGNICGGSVCGMHIEQTDADGRKNPRLNEHDGLERDEMDDFLRRVCDILNAMPKSHRHWTIEDIRAECERARGERKSPGGNPNSPERR